MSVPFGGGRTNIVSAFDIVRNQVFQANQGDRLGSPNLVVMFSDGSSNIRLVHILKYYKGACTLLYYVL